MNTCSSIIAVVVITKITTLRQVVSIFGTDQIVSGCTNDDPILCKTLETLRRQVSPTCIEATLNNGVLMESFNVEVST